MAAGSSRRYGRRPAADLEWKQLDLGAFGSDLSQIRCPRPIIRVARPGAKYQGLGFGRLRAPAVAARMDTKGSAVAG